MPLSRADRMHRDPRCEDWTSHCRPLPSCLVAIEQQHSPIEVAHEKLSLAERQTKAHERDDGRITSVVSKVSKKPWTASTSRAPCPLAAVNRAT
jgi:hypothetical protein